MAQSGGTSLLKFLRKLAACGAIAASIFGAGAQTQSVKHSRDGGLLIERPARRWEFLCAVGKRAAIFGNESGRVEAWVYPLKVLRDFHVTIHNDGKAIPAEA